MGSPYQVFFLRTWKVPAAKRIIAVNFISLKKLKLVKNIYHLTEIAARLITQISTTTFKNAVYELRL